MPKTPTDRLTDEESRGLKTLAFWLLILVLLLVFRHRIFPAAKDWRADLARVEDRASIVFLSGHARCLAAVSRSDDGEDPKARRTLLRGCLKEDPQNFLVKSALRDSDLDSNDPADVTEGRKLEDELAKERAGSMADLDKQVRKEMTRRAKLRPDQQDLKLYPVPPPQQPQGAH